MAQQASIQGCDGEDPILRRLPSGLSGKFEVNSEDWRITAGLRIFVQH